MGKHTEALPSFIMRLIVHLFALFCLSYAMSSANAAVCFNGQNRNISTFDINTGALELASSDPPGPHSYTIPSNGATEIVFNTALFCVRNLNSVAEDALAPDIGMGANEVSTQCCPGTMCDGGMYFFDEPKESLMILNVMEAGAACY